MKKRLLSVLMILTMLIPAIAAVIPVGVSADYDLDEDDFRCRECGSFLGDKDFCAECWFCENCVTVCDDCGYCTACAVEDELHCPECYSSCIDEGYGDVPHCENCHKCEECVSLYETANGVRCAECLEDLSETYIMCPNCEVNPIGTELEGDVDESDLDDILDAIDVGDCGEHCAECFEEFVCPECSECTLCKGIDLCDTCGICDECAQDNGYHCPDCGACYGEAGQCPDGGEHCTNCCERVCESCGHCADALDIEFCESCHMCEDCWEHCEICGECFEDNGQCEEYGDHCRECCISEDWICDQCGRCTEALDLDICDYCGLCEECCRDNSEYYGIDGCILDSSTDLTEIDESLHDENHHLLRYTSSSDECHDVWCAYPGCDYYLSDCTPHEFIWKTITPAKVGIEGKERGICKWCLVEIEKVIPKLDLTEYYFIDSPKKLEAKKEKEYVVFPVTIAKIGENPTYTEYANVSAIPYKKGDTLPETWAELRKNVYTFLCIRSQKGVDGVYSTAYIPGTSDAALGYGGKYVGYVAQGTKQTWILAVYDGRGDGSGKVHYSDPFEIDWNAPHKEHHMVYVCEKYNPKRGDCYVVDKNKEQFVFWDNTYHRRVCSECEYREGCLWTHFYYGAGMDLTCKSNTVHYVCGDCGHEFVRYGPGLASMHQWSDTYSYKGDNHYRVCKVCHATGEWGKHDLELSVFSNCEKRITMMQCKVCDYAHMEHETGSHKYTSDGDFNGWYGNSTKHWKVCTACGFVNEASHTYYEGACTVCGMDIPQMAIVGDHCVHGGSLRIELLDDLAPADKAEFNAGRYGVTWIDDDTGNTVGLGNNYELSAADEGRAFRAEISLYNGEDYYAYMYTPIKTEYMTVEGYPATCATEGIKSHSVCKECGRKFINGYETANVVIPKLTTHTYTNDCDPVCNVCGYVRKTAHKFDKYTFTEYGHEKKCSVCGYETGIVEHAFTTAVVKKKAKCGVEGLLHKTCYCGYETDEVIPAYVHKLERKEPEAATCVTYGYIEYYFCAGCGQIALDAEGKNTVGINKVQTPFDPKNHVGGDLGYNAKQHYIICACGAHLDPADHTFGSDDRCTVCHYVKGSKITVGNGKAMTKHDMVLSTCIDQGKKAYYTDGEGNIYLSKSGFKTVAEADLTLPLSTVRHVGGPYGYNDSKHWIDCACGEKLLTSDHKFVDGKCAVCGYSGGFPWWIFLIIGGGIVLGAGVVLLIFFLKKKEDEDEKEKIQGEAPPAGPEAETPQSEEPLPEQPTEPENPEGPAEPEQKE